MEIHFDIMIYYEKLLCSNSVSSVSTCSLYILLLMGYMAISVIFSLRLASNIEVHV